MSKQKRKAEYHIEGVGLVVEPCSDPERAIRFLLVRSKDCKTWRIYQCSGKAFRYYCYLFVLSATSYERFHRIRAKEGEVVDEEKTEFCIWADDSNYGVMVRYYSDLQKKEIKGVPKKYSEIPTELRLGMRSIFNIRRRSDRAADARIVFGPLVSIDTFRFWRMRDFAAGYLSGEFPKTVEHEELPGSLLGIEDIVHLQTQILESQLWRRWQRRAASQAKTRGGSAIIEKLRTYIEKEAALQLSKKLNDRDDYQTLEMEIGTVEERPRFIDAETAVDPRKSEPHDICRSWRTFSLESLLDPKGVYILASDTGTGKTTFLRYLQLQVLKHGKRIPIFLHARHIADKDYTDVRSFVSHVAEKLQPSLPNGDLLRFLNEEFHNRILMLVDGLDQIGGIGTEYEHVLDKLLGVCKDNLIVASRPTAVESLEGNKNVNFLRVKPFKESALKPYFGEHYQRARQLCERDQNLIAVPMLAYMVRTLIENRRDKGIRNRASLYKRFVHYILKEYVHEESKMSKDEQQTVRGLLREISYEALKSENPMVQRIPLEFCWKFTHKYKDIEIDKLPKYGLVNLIVDKSEGVEEYLYYSHQSFQEYLAAEWASRSEERMDYMIEHYWDPRWREVMRFLAGMVGEDLITRLYSGSQQDNSIHSRLILATECAIEARITPDCERRLSRDLKNAISVEPFPSDAVFALVRLKTASAQQDEAFRLFKNYFFCCELSEWFRQTGLLESLFSPKRLRRALDRVQNPDRFVGAQFAAWSSCIPQEVIERCIQELGTANEYKCSEACERLARFRESLNKKNFDDIFKRLHGREQVQSDLLFFFSLCPHFVDDKQRQWFVASLHNRHSCVMRKDSLNVIWVLAPHFSEEEVGQAFEFLWDFADEWSLEYARAAESVGRRLQEKHIAVCLEQLDSPAVYKRILAMTLLGEVSEKLNEEELQVLLKSLSDRNPLVQEYAINVATGIHYRLSSKQRRGILDMMRSKIERVRLVSINAIKTLWPYARDDHIDLVFHYLDSSHDGLIDREKKGELFGSREVYDLYEAAVVACMHLIDRLTTTQKWHWVQRLDRLCVSGMPQKHDSSDLGSSGCRTMPLCVGPHKVHRRRKYQASYLHFESPAYWAEGCDLARRNLEDRAELGPQMCIRNAT